MKHFAIIVAGGSGTRMSSSLPKQFLLLKDKPVLMHTIESFHNYNSQIEIILVLPDNQKDYWANLCLDYSFVINHTVVSGGQTRFQSVLNGLDVINAAEKALVAVHDGVRPLVKFATIERCFEVASKNGNAIPCVPLVDSLREVAQGNSKHVDRSLYKAIQTPQVFENTILQKAYKQTYSELFTDDASVVESMGIAINLVEGNIENIKITTPFDLVIAEALKKNS